MGRKTIVEARAARSVRLRFARSARHGKVVDKGLVTLEIISENVFISAYLLSALDISALACFILHHHHHIDEADDEDIMRERFTTFLRSQCDTLLMLELRYLSFPSEPDLVADIRACRKLRMLTVVDNCNMLGDLFLDSLTLDTIEVQHNDTEPGTFILEPDCSNPFLEKIEILRYLVDIADFLNGDLYPKQFYIGLVDMVKSRCDALKESNVVVNWNVEKPADIDMDDLFVEGPVSKLAAFTLCEDDADWIKENLPEEWAILEQCEAEGLILVEESLGL